MELDWYVLFPNHENGLKLYNILKEHQIYAVIAPTPRALSKSCGISLKIKEAEKEIVEQYANQQQVRYIGIECLKKKENSRRDKYC
ncbi:DUF3343 domain-containing protein [Velocimicrobium porci]|uniref:DUF3343 domain-containing protein n=1 Tax=Velocimicrobium porci TaxID=2606634 RepID=A0A6L5XW27_9FIRM|nr:DUF3343 domain-containing protein [Velocimicrobium porci]MSS62809.1 DUF3343 domain-containing protein [Velocimicrobium porci]